MDALAPAAVFVPVFALVAVVLVTTTRAAARGDLPRNAWVGIRTGATGMSDVAWKAGHAAALGPMKRCAGACAAAAAVVLGSAVAGAGEGTVFLLAVAGVVALLLLLFRGVQRADAAAEAADRHDERRHPR